jgi:tetraprenyl-beta-curcumene synthase
LKLSDEIAWAVRHVLASRARRRFLFGGGLRGIADLVSFLRRIVPLASRALAAIEADAGRIPDALLREEALSSVRNKAYHVAGGCILATFLPPERARRYVEIVAPLESIYDYLDNLCDRHPNVSADAYPVLHDAIADALDPNATIRDYYARGPGDDGGYLASLVHRSQEGIRALPGYESLAPHFAEAAQFYAGLQTYKHLPPGDRERACLAWFERYARRFPDLEWFEFASAAGSQFQVYVPLYYLASGEPGSTDVAYDAYFPAVAALHVLLDAFIDQAEDRAHEELNLFNCYASAANALARMRSLCAKAYAGFEGLPRPHEHRFLLRTMALFYLTHPKLYPQHLDAPAQALLRAFA